MGLTLIDNAHWEFPVVVSSLSSLSSKAPIVNVASAVGSVSVIEVAFELKVLLFFLVESVLCESFCFFVFWGGLCFFCVYLRALLVALRTL